jgi:serine phosphatase RsbU (regulator of sigma subunit)
MLLEYSGANNPLVMVRNGEVIAYDATKAPIGAFVGEKLTLFKQENIQIQKGDMFYIFSDGYADQFGGTEGKKFMKRRFKELLGEISIQPAAKQKELLEKVHLEWKGDGEQIDDILVIGIRV